MNRSLLERYFRGDVSAEEARQVVDWLRSSEAETEIEKQVERYFEGDSHKKIIWNSEDIHNTIHSKIKSQITNGRASDVNELPGPTRKRGSIFIWKMAAVVVLLLIPAATFFWYFKMDTEVVAVSPAMAIKQASKGQKLSIYLSDGTKVILNSDSEIRYPTSFDKKNRVVHIKGEAFFEVTKDPARPFIVQTPTFHTVVLGTSFNVSAKPHCYKNTVALKSGRVLVRTGGADSVGDGNVFLKPGEMLTIHAEEKTSEITEFNEKLVFGWTRNTLFFKEEPLENVFARLETWYAVEFHFNKKYEQKKRQLYSGEFENESLKNVLAGLGYVNDFEFKIVDKSVEIKFN